MSISADFRISILRLNFRPRGLSARGHIQHRRPSVKKDVLAREPQADSKWRILLRPLSFTIMVS